jgi:excisionase family DNA binding protein
MWNAPPIFFCTLSPAKRRVYLRLRHCSVLQSGTLRQRVCEPHFAASDSLEHRTMSTENMTTDNLALRPREAAKALGISERSLWEWTHRGDVPHVRVGRAILYPVDVLRNWLRLRAEATKGGQNDSR